MEKPVLEMKGITKRFPGVIANDSVDLTLYPGEIHALLGENGAGKSTLMNILTGIYAPNDGEIRYDGQRVAVKSPKSAVALGIGMVHQHFKLIETLTVAENIFLAAGKSCKFALRQREMEAQIRKCSEEYGLRVDASARVDQLSVGEQQRVEIVKLLFCGAKLLILDEPTAVLTPQETEQLFKNLRAMTQTGKAVLFITHKLFEVMSYSDRITVLRGGKSVGTMPTAQIDQAGLVTMMVGRAVEKLPTERKAFTPRRAVLNMQNVTAMGDKHLPALNGLDLTIYAGEILGLAGVAGNGQRELTEVISGLRRVTGGTITLDGKDMTNASVKRARHDGVAYIPDDRMGMGLVGAMDMMENVILRRFDAAEYSRKGILKQGEIEKRTEQMVAAFEIKNAGIELPVSLMSGGNLQKLLLAREVSGNPKLIIAAYPVHGVDIGATVAIHQVLLKERARGAAILLISEDLEELFEMSDRVGALYEGRVVDMIDIKDFTYEGVGRMMAGVCEAQMVSQTGGGEA